MALRLNSNDYGSPRVQAGGAAAPPKPKTTWIPSPNLSSRPGGASDIDTIVLHHTAGGGTAEDVGRYFQKPSAKVSAHYIVGKDGQIVQSVPDGKAAWHAGKSVFKGRGQVNDFSIGIEIVNRGDNKDPYPEAQYVAVADLVAWLMKTYNVPMDRLTGHRDVALPKGRKDDPSDNFDWDRVRKLVRERLNGQAPKTPGPNPASPQNPDSPGNPAPPASPAPPVYTPALPAPLPGPAPIIQFPTPVPALEALPFDQLLAHLHTLVQQSQESLAGDRPTPPVPAPAGPDPKPAPERTGGSGPLLRRGVRGEPVRQLQKRLADLGFDPGPIDGIFGPLTERAVKRFQTDRQIEIDGIVGPQTWDRLGIKVEGNVQRPDPGSNLEIGREGEMATVQGFKMTPATAEAFVKMAEAASRDGITLRISSAWRSDEHQARLYEEAIRKYGSPEAARKWVAPPGKSNHRTGRALDINTSDAIYAWLKANGPRFGFRQPMSWEPWHWEHDAG